MIVSILADLFLVLLIRHGLLARDLDRGPEGVEALRGKEGDKRSFEFDQSNKRCGDNTPCDLGAVDRRCVDGLVKGRGAARTFLKRLELVERELVVCRR